MTHKYMILLTIFLWPTAHAADGLGRLFFTPQQRTELDVARARRDQRLPVTAEPETVTPPPPAPRGPDTVTYSGMVRRSDGKSTVWLNGKPINERNRLGGPSDVNVVGMRDDGAVSVAVPQASRRASLKVGQRLDVDSGRIEESYGRRATLPRIGDSPAPFPPTLSPVPAESRLRAPEIPPSATMLDETLKRLRTWRDNTSRESSPENSVASPGRVKQN